MICFLFTDIYYCQRDDADESFQTFCGQFLPDLSVEKLSYGDSIPKRLFMVLSVPNDNRQNNPEVLKESIKEIMNRFEIKGNYK